MVSFSCEGCGDVLTKKKLDQHRNRCRGATFTCIDCMVYFPGTEYRSHTSCMTEDQKYQGALYKNKKAKTSKNTNNEPALSAPVPKNMAQQAYVEDAVEEFAAYQYDDRTDDGRSPADLPEAPTPPPAAEGPVNVFDFLDNSVTPNPSTLGGPGRPANEETNEEMQMVRFDPDAHGYLDHDGVAIDEDPDALVQYGLGPIPPYETPANGTMVARRRERRKTGTELKKDKKRKRLHVDTDAVMDDAPPMLHTGLTGGINRMMRSHLPPSPDYSGGDGADMEAEGDAHPASPLKKKKHSKQHSSSSKAKRTSSMGSNLMGLFGSSSNKSSSKSKKRRVSSGSTKKSSRSRAVSDGKAPKLIEYRPQTQDGEVTTDAEGDSQQMVVFRPRADLLLSFVNKGPESERGYSMKKALRHFHDERNGSVDNLGKTIEEKELWRSLRMRKNDRGEVVLFGL